MNITEKYCTSIITMFNDVIRTYEYNLDVIKQLESEQTDLEHEIELGNPKNACEGYQLYRQLREVRLKRRKAKDENALLADLYDFLKTQSNFKNKISQIQGNAAKVYEKQQTRTYTPRVRSDLTCTDRVRESYRPFEEMLKDFKETKVTTRGGKLIK